MYQAKGRIPHIRLKSENSPAFIRSFRMDPGWRTMGRETLSIGTNGSQHPDESKIRTNCEKLGDGMKLASVFLLISWLCLQVRARSALPPQTIRTSPGPSGSFARKNCLHRKIGPVARLEYLPGDTGQAQREGIFLHSRRYSAGQKT